MTAQSITNAVVLALLLQHVVNSFSATFGKTARDISGPTAWPVVGTVPDFFASGGTDAMTDVHELLCQDYGDVHQINLGGGNDDLMFCLCNPLECKRVFPVEGKHPCGGS